MKLKRKYSCDTLYVGTVGSTALYGTGRTKREANKRLRRAFLAMGIPTIQSTFVDGMTPTRDLAFIDLLNVRQGP